MNESYKLLWVQCMLLAIFMFVPGDTTLSSIGKREQGDKLLLNDYFKSSTSYNMQNHTIEFAVPVQNRMTCMKFNSSTPFTTSTVSFHGENVNNVLFTAYNSTGFSLNVTLYGFERKRKSLFYQAVMQVDEKSQINFDEKVNGDDKQDEKEEMRSLQDLFLLNLKMKKFEERIADTNSISTMMATSEKEDGDDVDDETNEDEEIPPASSMMNSIINVSASSSFFKINEVLNLHVIVFLSLIIIIQFLVRF